MKKKQIKARKLWADSKRMIMCPTNYNGKLSYYGILPVDAKSYELMVQQIAAAASKGWIQKKAYNESDRAHIARMMRYYRRRARIYLRAIGIVAPKKGIK